MMQPTTGPALARYLKDVSTWRRARYEDDLRDRRNLQSAASLDALADYVLTLPDDDARLERLSMLAMHGETFEAGQQAGYEIGRFHFHSTEASLDGFLDRIVELAEQDWSESGRFGGRQAAGDDPWTPTPE